MLYSEYSIHSNVDESKNITVITNVSSRQNIDKTNLSNNAFLPVNSKEKARKELPQNSG